jgi:integrase
MIGCRPLNHDEKQRLLAVAKHNKRNQLLVMLGLASGFRISEMLSLRVKDLVAPDGSILDRITLKAANTKTGEGRVQILHIKVKTAVKEWTDHLISKGFGLESAIFVGRQSKGSKAITRQRAWQILKDLFAKAGIYGQTGTHTLRKTFAKEMKMRLGDIHKVANALGHKSITSTICYLSFDHTEVDNAILAMEL